MLGRLYSRYISIDMLSFSFWTPELLTMFRSLNRSTKRILDEDRMRIEANSTRLSSVTCGFNDLANSNLSSSEMMVDVTVEKMDTLHQLVELNKLKRLNINILKIKKPIRWDKSIKSLETVLASNYGTLSLELSHDSLKQKKGYNGLKVSNLTINLRK